MLLKLAWRNVWRNKRRSLITMTALTLGVCAIVLGTGYRDALYGQMIAQITDSQLGDIQIHGKGWQAEPELANVVPDPGSVEARLGAVLPAARPARRVMGYGLAGAEEQSAAVLVMGVQPEREPSGQGPLTVLEGRDLGRAPRKEAVLGRALAEQLGIAPLPAAGAPAPAPELVILGQAADGSVANDRFEVVGVADAGNAELDASAVFLHLADAQDFFGLGAGVHQVLLRLPDEGDLEEHLEALRGALDTARLEALSWEQLVPELRGMIEQKKKGQGAVFFVVFLIVGLGALNAMTMSTFERTREFGVMASLGTRRGQIVRLVLAEALLQAVLGFAAGLALAAALAAAFGNVEFGALFSGDAMGVRMPSHVSMTLGFRSAAQAGATVLITMLAGGLWPAIRASRLKPVEATRYV